MNNDIFEQKKSESVVVKSSYGTSLLLVLGYILKENGIEIESNILEAIIFLVLSAILPIFYALNNPERKDRM